MGLFALHLPNAAVIANEKIDPATQPAAATQDSTAALIEQIHFWEARNNTANLKEALEKLFRIHPNHPEGLAIFIRLEIKENHLDSAKWALQRMRQSGGNTEDVNRLSSLLEAHAKNKDKFAQAQLLAKGGKSKEAKILFEELFPAGFPTGEIELDYWQTVANSENGWLAARNGLSSLSQRFPDSMRFRMAFLDHEVDQADITDALLEQIETLTYQPEYERTAIRAWRKGLKRLPLTGDHHAAFDKFLQRYPKDDAVDEILKERKARAVAQLTQERSEKYALRVAQQLTQKRLTQDTYYQAKLAALKLLDQDSQDSETQLNEAEKLLLKAKRRYDQDAEIYGGLGYVFLRRGNHAVAEYYFRQALALAPDNKKQWSAMITTSRFWGLMRKINSALEKNSAEQLQAAALLIRQAEIIDPLQPQLYRAKAELAIKNRDYLNADQFYRKAIKLDPLNTSALRGLVKLYENQGNHDQAEKILSSFNVKQQAELKDFIADLHITSVRQQTEIDLQQGREAAAILRLEAALKLAPRNPWLRYDLSRIYLQQQIPEAGDMLFRDGLQLTQNAVDMRYAYSLFLSSANRIADSLAQLQSIAPAERSENMLSLIERLKVNAQMDLIEVYLATQQQSQAQAGIRLLLNHADKLLVEEKIQLAKIIVKLDTATATDQFITQLIDERPYDRDMLVVAGQYADRHNQPQLAEKYFRRALAVYYQERTQQGSAIDLFQNDIILDYHADDPWDIKVVKDRLLEKKAAQNGHIIMAYDDGSRSATAGLSDLHMQTYLTEIRWPITASQLPAGHLVFRYEPVRLDAGKVNYLQAQSDANEFGSLLLCTSNCPATAITQTADGNSYALGYDTKQWRFDLGMTPQGFPVDDVIGGFEYDGELGDYSWSVDLSKRPITSSLLSFAGTEDPQTGKIWGGVRATGISVDGGWDLGGSYGIWTNIGFHQLTGQNVQDNDRCRLMGGIYWRLRETDPYRLDLGGSLMSWKYQHDAGEFTFGQGGYYSPQSYFSLSIPANLYGRQGKFSYLLRAAVAQSWSKDDDAPFYPTDDLMQTAAENLIAVTGVTPTFEGGASSGFGYSLRGRLEYELTTDFYIGGAIEIERAESYEPNRFTLWLRYLFEPTLKPIPVPPIKVIPYAEF